jgi:hypothetical protein
MQQMKFMKRNQLLLLLTLFLSGIVSAQNKLRIGIGFQRTWMLDRQASPLKYQTSEKTFLLGYEHAGTKSLFRAEVNGAIGAFFPTGFRERKWYNPGYHADGSPKKDSGLLGGNIYHARIKVGYAREVSSGHTVVGKETFSGRRFLGASLNNQLFYTDNIVRTGWLNSNSVNADFVHMVTNRARHQVTFKLSIPLFARNTRLPYHNTVSSSSGEGNVKTIMKQGSRFATLLDFQNIQAEAGYEFAVSNKVGLGVQYTGQWLRYNYEKPINLFQNNIGIVATIK